MRLRAARPVRFGRPRAGLQVGVQLARARPVLRRRLDPQHQLAALPRVLRDRRGQADVYAHRDAHQQQPLRFDAYDRAFLAAGTGLLHLDSSKLLLHLES